LKNTDEFLRELDSSLHVLATSIQYSYRFTNLYVKKKERKANLSVSCRGEIEVEKEIVGVC
jgi:hypothetical protein